MFRYAPFQDSAFGPSIFNLARASKSESPEKLFDKLSVSIFNFKFPNQSLDKSMITISLLDILTIFISKSFKIGVPKLVSIFQNLQIVKDPKRNVFSFPCFHIIHKNTYKKDELKDSREISDLHAYVLKA